MTPSLLASIALLAPALVAGLAMLSLPIAAHLYKRRVPNRQIYPSLTLIMAVAAGRNGLRNLRRLLLLFLRALAIAAIVVAFARPVWLGARASADPLEPHALIIVLDNSASTRQTVRGRAVSDELRTHAFEMINRLRVGIDYAGVIVADLDATAVLPELSLNLPVLIEELGDREPGAGAADLAGAIRLGAAMLKARAGPARLVILTDAQTTAWELALRDLDLSPPSLPEQTEIELRTPKAPPPLNVTIADPVWKPAGLSAGMPAKLEVAIAATTYREHQETIERTLQIELNGRPAGGVKLDLKPGIWTRLQLELPPLAGGPVHTSVSIGRDGLDADNRIWAAAFVQERPSIAVIAARGMHNRPGTSAFYLTRAIAPAGADENPYRVVQLETDHVSNETLRTHTAILLCDGGTISDEGVDALWRYVNGGGLLLGVPAPDLSSRTIAALDLTAGAQGFWPWQQGRPTRVNDRLDAPAGLSQRAPSVLTNLSNESWLALERPVFEIRGQIAEHTVEGNVLLRFASGVPALGYRRVGDGTAVLANFSLDVATTDLATHGVFVALLHELLGRLATASEADADVEVGSPLHLRLPDAKSVTVQDPSGVEAAARRVTGDENSLWIEKTHTPGLYKALQDGQVIACGAVNIPTSEGQLNRITDEELRDRVTAACTRTAAQGIAEDLGHFEPGGKPIAYIALLLGAVMLFIEQLVSALWRSR